MEISVKSNLKQFIKAIKTDRDQIPYATARALTETAVLASIEMTDDIDKTFRKTGRPSPFTLRAMDVDYAKKTHLQARVFVKPIQAEYLKLEVEGGTRTPSSGTSSLSIPRSYAPTNSYGKLGKGTVRRLASQKNYFIGEEHGVHGLFKRIGRGKMKTVQLVVLFKKSGRVAKQWDFFGKVHAFVQREIGPSFQRWFAQAVATNKR